MSTGAEDPAHLSENDVRAMVRLIGEVANINGDQSVKRRAIMERVAEMVDADCWLWSMFRLCKPDGGAMTVGLMHGGLSEQDVARVTAAETDPNLPKPENAALLQLLSDGQHFTRRRIQMVDDADWYDHPHTKSYRQDWLDDCVYSVYPIPPDSSDDENANNDLIVSAIGLHRRWGREPFTAREARLVHIIASEVSWLHHAAMPGNKGEGTQHLAARLRPVLALLMDGQSRKRIALHLDLSVHTVGDYIKEIYRHFDVSGRIKLMHHFMAGNGGDREPKG